MFFIHTVELPNHYVILRYFSVFTQNNVVNIWRYKKLVLTLHRFKTDKYLKYRRRRKEKILVTFS